MKKPIALRRLLFLNTLAVLFLGMSLAAILAWRSVEGLYLQTQRENLLAQAKLTAAALQDQPLPENPAQPYSQTANVQPGIHTRLLGEQGAVLYSLPISPGNLPAPPAENGSNVSPGQLLARPEIAAAMRGQPDTAIRSVIGRRVLYAAVPVIGQDRSVSAIVYLAMPLPAGGLPGSLALQLLGAGLAAGLLALTAGTLLARRVTAPIEIVARAAAEVSGGDLQQQVPISSRIGEIDSLGRAFNQMTAGLRQADQAKNAFVGDVTHELRNPLTVIKGTIETLQDGALDDLAWRGPLLDSMQRETERLIRLVNDLLVLTRAGAGALNLEIAPLDLFELARERSAHLAPLAAAQGLQLAVTGIQGSLALGDADRLAQVLDNLLDNAVRYSPPGSTITIEIKPRPGEIQCTVRDQGPGIPTQHLPFIFDRFYRADASRSRQTGGTGLGLSIVRALVLAQHGQVCAQSVEGQGTTIGFTIPSAPAGSPPPHEESFPQ